MYLYTEPQECHILLWIKKFRGSKSILLWQRNIIHQLYDWTSSMKKYGGKKNKKERVLLFFGELKIWFQRLLNCLIDAIYDNMKKRKRKIYVLMYKAEPFFCRKGLYAIGVIVYEWTLRYIPLITRILTIWTYFNVKKKERRNNLHFPFDSITKKSVSNYYYQSQKILWRNQFKSHKQWI